MNFANFDKDGDGQVDALGIIYAGGGANDGCYAGSTANNIWPHEWNTSGTSTSDGVSVKTYIMVPELTDDAALSGACDKIQTMISTLAARVVTWHGLVFLQGMPSSTSGRFGYVVGITFVVPD